jgi:hypothetical protein
MDEQVYSDGGGGGEGERRECKRCKYVIVRLGVRGIWCENTTTREETVTRRAVERGVGGESRDKELHATQ